MVGRAAATCRPSGKCSPRLVAIPGHKEEPRDRRVEAAARPRRRWLVAVATTAAQVRRPERRLRARGAMADAPSAPQPRDHGVVALRRLQSTSA